MKTKRLSKTEVKEQYAHLQKGLHNVEEVRSSLYRLIFQLQEKCPHPIEEAGKWERIPMGWHRGKCGCCGADVWYENYKPSDRKKLEFTYRR